MRAVVRRVIGDLNEIMVQFSEAPGLKRGDVVEVKIQDEAKRSKNANAFYWVMNGKLAQLLNTSGEAIYKHQIRDMAVRQVLLIETKAVDDFTKMWTNGHLGRFVETRESQQEGKTIVLAYYGSSDFTKREMYRLMENLKTDLDLYGIDYNSEEIMRLVENWGG